MLYIAHRGHSSNKIDENKIKGIKNAIELNYDGIEIDVQLCKSGEIVLFHDIYINQTFIKDLTYQELNEKHDIISLQYLYDKLPEIQNKLLIIDIKGIDREIITQLELFYDNIDTSNVYFCSFNRQILLTMNNKFNRGSTFEAVFTFNEYEMLTKGLQCLVVHWTCLNSVLTMYCKLNNIKLFVYTHKTNIQYKYIIKFEPYGIITDSNHQEVKQTLHNNT